LRNRHIHARDECLDCKTIASRGLQGA